MVPSKSPMARTKPGWSPIGSEVVTTGGGIGVCGGVRHVSIPRPTCPAELGLRRAGRDTASRARPRSGAPRMSLMTATESAPASMTSAAFSSLMPPMATIGLSVRRANPADQIRSNDGIGIRFGRSGENRTDSDVVGGAVQRLPRNCSRLCVEIPMILSPTSVRVAATPRSSCPTWTPEAFAIAATSGRSFTMNVIPCGWSAETRSRETLSMFAGRRVFVAVLHQPHTGAGKLLRAIDCRNG